MKKTITIFGGTGDLTFRKLLPAMYNMHVTGGEGAGYDIVIIGRRNYTSGEYRQIARDWVKQFSRLPFTEEKYKDFSEKIEYYRMDYPLHQPGFCKQLEQGRGQLHPDFRHGGCGRGKQGRLL